MTKLIRALARIWNEVVELLHRTSLEPAPPRTFK